MTYKTSSIRHFSNRISRPSRESGFCFCIWAEINQTNSLPCVFDARHATLDMNVCICAVSWCLRLFISAPWMEIKSLWKLKVFNVRFHWQADEITSAYLTVCCVNDLYISMINVNFYSITKKAGETSFKQVENWNAQ
jgi:hypothetical protein